jgi:YHS domain-containing protein
MKVWIWGIVFWGLAACEQKRAPTPAVKGQAERALAATPVPDSPEAEKPHVGPVAPVTSSGTNAQPNSIVVVQERSQVCMVNDQYMGREQIPVTIADKTYYGCCPMCKGRLERDPAARAAKDPVSGSLVDKATAVIGRSSSGQVFYFESEDTLRQYKL